jgi:tRNA (guanine37-N1)-methyltransferase
VWFDAGREKGFIDIRVHDLRDFTSDRHRQSTIRPFGGGEGMVFKPEPIFKAVESVRREATPR